VGWSHWRSRPDAVAGAATNQRSDALYGFYRFGAFKVGAAMNRARLEAVATGATTARRTAWTIPVAWFGGPHTVAFTYTRAGDDKATAADDKARMIAAAYSYDLSKRTAVGLTYAQIRNNPGAAYNLFTNTTTGFGSGQTGTVSASTVAAGEDPRTIALTLRHAF